jgi:hypothetical protein
METLHGGYLPDSPDLVYTISQYLDLDVQVADKTWTFDKDGDLQLPAGGDIKNSSGVSVLTGNQGQENYLYNGIDTTKTITTVNFSVLYCTPAAGYTGSDTHTVVLPAGTSGQRLAIINNSSNCQLTLDLGYPWTWYVATSGKAELIYVVDPYGGGDWIIMYGAAQTP